MKQRFTHTIGYYNNKKEFIKRISTVRGTFKIDQVYKNMTLRNYAQSKSL